MSQVNEVKLHTFGAVSIGGVHMPGDWVSCPPGQGYYEDRQNCIISPVMSKADLRKWIASNLA